MNAETSRIRLTLILTALFVAVVPAVASAAPQGPWQLPATDLSETGQNAQSPQIGAAPDGTATSVWYRSNGSNNIIQAATRPPGESSFGEAVDLSETGQNAEQPQIGVAPDGTATAVWRRYNGSNFIIQAATRPPGGSFGEAVDLSETGGGAYLPQIGVAPDGTATAVWTRSDGSSYIIQAATRPPGESSFGEAVDLSETGQNALGPQIGVAPDGTATAIWDRSDGTNSIIQAATRPPGGSFGEAVDLSETGQNASKPQIGFAPDGTATAVWYRYNGSKYVIEAATRPPGGSFGEAVDLSETGQNAQQPQIGFAPDGTATAVWTRSNGSSYIIQAATRPPGESSFGEAVDLSETGQDTQQPQIGFAPDGTATAIWNRYSGSNYVIEAATRPPGGSFGEAVDLSETGQNALSPQIGVAPDGTATAIWGRSDGTNVRIQSASTVQPSFLLQTERSGTGTGTVTSGPPGIDCGTDCSENYPSFTKVTLTATPYAGSTFTGWSGACSGTGSCVVTMDQARSVSASFELQQRALTLTKNGNGAGSVTSTPAGIDCGPTCSSDFDYGTEVTLTAAAAEGSTFTGWSGAGCSGTGSCVVTMDQAHSVSASFELQQRALTLTKNGNGAGSVTSAPAGIDCGPTCSSDFDYGTEVTLTAAAAEGSTFTGWSGAGCSGTGSCVVTMDQAHSVSASFELQEAPLAVAKISKVKVKGPAKVKRGKKATYKVKIKNGGNAQATGVRLKVKGKGIKSKKSVGKIAAGKTKPVKFKFKPKKPDKIKVSFKVTSKNAGGKTVKKKITVRK